MKLRCLLFGHSYKDTNLQMTHLLDSLDGKYWIYRAENKCVYCGAPYQTIVSFPVPKELQEASK